MGRRRSSQHQEASELEPCDRKPEWHDEQFDRDCSVEGSAGHDRWNDTALEQEDRERQARRAKPRHGGDKRDHGLISVLNAQPSGETPARHLRRPNQQRRADEQFGEFDQGRGDRVPQCR